VRNTNRLHGDRLTLAIDRWSTDAERDQLVASINTNGSEKLLDAFRDVPRLGTLSWPGGTEYTLRFARRAGRPDGGSDLVLVVDRPLWLWWESNPPSTPYPFSVIQIKLGKDGTGEGRVSAGVPVSSDKSLGAWCRTMPKDRRCSPTFDRSGRRVSVGSDRVGCRV